MKKELITLLIHSEYKPEQGERDIFNFRYTQYATSETDFWERAFKLERTDIVVFNIDDTQSMDKIKRLVDIDIQIVATTHSNDVSFHIALYDLGVMDIVQIPFDDSVIRSAVMNCITMAMYKIPFHMNKDSPFYNPDLRITSRAV